MWRQGTTIARFQLVEPLPSIAAQRLVARYPLGEQEAFDPVDVLDPLDGQRLALSGKSATVFAFRRRRPNHGADARFTALVREQRANQCFAIDPISLGSPPPARGRNRGRNDPVTPLSPSFPHTVNPKPIQSRLNDDDRERLSGLRERLLLEF